MDKVVHFEIPADDLERARKFYTSVFGWKMESVPEMEYILIGTTLVDEKGMPTEPGGINGGKIIREKMQVGDMGYAAYFKDTEGNIIGLWQKIG